MQKFVLFSLCAAAALGIVSAQTAPAKVGTINIQGAILGTKEGQKAAQELDQKYGAASQRRKTLESRQGEINALKDRMQKTSNTASADQKEQLARDIDTKTKAFNREMEDAQAESEQDQQRILQEIGGKMMAVIQKYAVDKGYAMILDTSNQQTPVIWASDTVDVTRDVIALYDQNAPSMAAPPATPSATGGRTTPGTTPGTVAPRQTAPAMTAPGTATPARRPAAPTSTPR